MIIKYFFNTQIQEGRQAPPWEQHFSYISMGVRVPCPLRNLSSIDSFHKGPKTCHVYPSRHQSSHPQSTARTPEWNTHQDSCSISCVLLTLALSSYSVFSTRDFSYLLLRLALLANFCYGCCILCSIPS